MLVHAYHKRSGRKVLVRDAVLTSPVLGGAFSKTPRQKAADTKKAKAPVVEAPPEVAVDATEKEG